MMDIMICEDNDVQRLQLEEAIMKEAEKLRLNINLAVSTCNPKEILEKIMLHKDKDYVYFLDVELEDKINGIELARLIRRHDPKGYIIFVTSHAELTLLTFEYKVQAMDYIIKGNMENLKVKIRECLKEISDDLNRVKSYEKDYISLDIGNRIINLIPDDIMFFETGKDHRIRLHTKDEIIDFYSSLKEIEKIVPGYFYKCHRSYIVNTRNIKSLDKSNLVINMKNGDTCYISKRYMKGILKNV
ncbi:response regulator transcription factor [Clostridium sp. YIM B02505]|uniref:Stage 0 sporulation protein A homolog n=2 Tax=Clostridium yunnanense TaxID=2800325 RepID=A0ABS1EWJ7_9CLOT|nr:response regulator transcription factor [Clostridium yunnanense]